MAFTQRVFADKEAISQAFVSKIEAMAGRAISPLKLALSGGSTPKRAYELLSKSAVDRSKLKLFMVDERYVPVTDERSNEAMMREALNLPSPVLQEQNGGGAGGGGSFDFQPMYREGGPSVAAEAYHQMLRQEVDRFDLVLLGMGADGHTASLFPSMLPDEGHPGFMPDVAAGKWCVASQAPVVCPDRITLTFRAICYAKQTIFMIAGADKAPVLRQVLDASADDSLPAKFVRRQSADCEFWLDAEVASLL